MREDYLYYQSWLQVTFQFIKKKQVCLEGGKNAIHKGIQIIPQNRSICVIASTLFSAEDEITGTASAFICSQSARDKQRHQQLKSSIF